MPSVSVPAIASVAAAGIGAYGSMNAAGTQAQGAQNAANTNLQMYQQTRQDLLPYMSGGAGAYSQLQQLLGIGGGGGGGSSTGVPSYGASGTALVNSLNGMGQTQEGSIIQQMISSGASPQQIQSAIQTWGQHTTSPTNAAGKANVFQTLQGLQATAPTATTGGAGTAGGTAGMLATLRNYPGYQWALSQGQAAQDASAAARGLTLSGGQIAANQQYGQGMADQLFNQYYGQLMGTAQLGENAAAGSGSLGAAAAGQAGQAQYASGVANASGIAGATNQIGGILSNQNLMGQLFNSGGGGGGISPVSVTPDVYGNYTSDRRAKTAIRKIGRLDSGLPVYSYRYKGSPLPQIGVMADDVEKVAPEAVSLGHDGYKRVSYAKVSQLPAMRSAA